MVVVHRRCLSPPAFVRAGRCAAEDLTVKVPRRRIPCRPVDTASAAIVGTSTIAAGAAVANWWSRIDDRRRVELVTKPVATVAIGTLALLVAEPGTPNAAIVAAVIGFVLCLAGDVALLPAVDRFVVGLGAFLAGHVAFVVMFFILGLDRWWLGAIALAGAVAVVVVIGRPIIAGARAQDPALLRPVQAYLAIISSMAVVGWATGRPAAIIGSSLFVLSDSILGRRQFVSQRRWMPVAIMMTYHGALLGLALTLAG
jgi:uncharacterized membrane protein YhhN